MRCDIIILVWNQFEYTQKCLDSILQNTQHPFQLILIDNASQPETKNFLENFYQQHKEIVTLVRNEENIGFVRGTTQGFKLSTAPYVCLLNNDTIVTKGWLSNMIATMEAYPGIGVMNPTWDGPAQKTPDECAEFLAHNKGQFLETNECIGFCMLIKREVIDKIGYLDPAFDMGGLDDSDYSKRAVLAGYRCARAKDSYVFHWENTSIKLIKDWREDRQKKTDIFESKWGKPKRIAVLLEESAGGEKKTVDDLRFLLDLARVGTKIHVFLLVPQSSPLRNPQYRFSQGLPEHNNLSYRYCPYAGFPLVKFLFALDSFFLIMSRRFKKQSQRYNALVASRPFPQWFFRKTAFLHGLAVFFEAKDCSLLHQELAWLHMRNMRDTVSLPLMVR